MKKLLAIVIGVIISVLGVIAISFIVGGNSPMSIIGARASDIEPREVVVTEIKDTSVTIEWITDQAVQQIIEYGVTPEDLTLFEPEVEPTKEHKRELALLVPGTTYYFQIRSGDRVFNNNGVPWTFTTKNIGQGQGAKPTTDNVIKRDTNPFGAGAGQLPEGSARPTQPPTNGSSSLCKATTCDEIRAQMGFAGNCSTEDLAKRGCL